MTNSDKVYTLKESAALLRISRPTALALVRQKKLRATSIGPKGQWRITDAALNAFLCGSGGRGEEEKTAS